MVWVIFIIWVIFAVVCVYCVEVLEKEIFGVPFFISIVIMFYIPLVNMLN